MTSTTKFELSQNTLQQITEQLAKFEALKMAQPKSGHGLGYVTSPKLVSENDPSVLGPRRAMYCAEYAAEAGPRSSFGVQAAPTHTVSIIVTIEEDGAHTLMPQIEEIA